MSYNYAKALSNADELLQQSKLQGADYVTVKAHRAASRLQLGQASYTDVADIFNELTQILQAQQASPTAIADMRQWQVELAVGHAQPSEAAGLLATFFRNGLEENPQTLALYAVANAKVNVAWRNIALASAMLYQALEPLSRQDNPCLFEAISRRLAQLQLHAQLTNQAHATLRRAGLTLHEVTPELPYFCPPKA